MLEKCAISVLHLNMNFTWDPKKAIANLRKHCITFEEAATVFSDPLALIVTDDSHRDRAILFGESIGFRILLVVFLEIDGQDTGLLALAALQRMKGNGMKKAVKKHQREPSKASLQTMPEVDFSTSHVRPNPYAKRISAEGITVQVGRGRPQKMFETGGTIPRSVRFSSAIWALLEERAKERGLSLHAALREAILAWTRRAA